MYKWLKQLTHFEFCQWIVKSHHATQERANHHRSIDKIVCKFKGLDWRTISVFCVLFEQLCLQMWQFSRVHYGLSHTHIFSHNFFPLHSFIQMMRHFPIFFFKEFHSESIFFQSQNSWMFRCLLPFTVFTSIWSRDVYYIRRILTRKCLSN